MKKKIRIILALFYLVVLFCSCNNQKDSTTENVPEYIFTYAENHPDKYPTTKGAYKFAELVEERTDGRIRIQVKADAEFGTQQQTVNQMKFGGVDFARVSLSSLSDELPKLNVLQLPFLYEDSEHMWRVLDGEIGSQFWDAFYELDLVPLSWYDAGARSFYSVNPINTVKDMQGLKVRVQESELMRDMITSLGGTPVDMAYSEVYSAFETKEIDAAENSWSSYYNAAHYMLARFYTLDEHTRVPEIQLISGETWRLLSDTDRKIIKECAQESAKYEKKLWKEEEQLSRAIAVAYGIEEIVLSEEELQKFRDCVTPLYEKYCSEYMDIILDIKAQGKESEK